MQETNTIESHIGELCSFLFYKILNVRMIIVSQRSLSKTASSLRIKEVRAITKNPKEQPSNFPMVSPMQLYEIYQNITLGTSISCVVGLALAWILLLSNQNK